MTDKKVSLMLTCTDDEGCMVWFEPWGAEHFLARGDVFHVEIRGEGSGEVEVTHSTRGLSVSTWPGGDFSVRNAAGKELPT